MAKTITEASEQPSTGLDRVKSRGDKGGSGGGRRSELATNGDGQGGSMALNPIRGWEQLTSFLRDVRSEMRKVVSPTREEVQSTTTIVIITVFVFAAFFALVDYLCGSGVQWLFNHFTK